LVAPETSSDESDINNEETLRSIHSKNPFVKLLVVGRINDKIKNLIGKDTLTQIDTNLLKGMFKKRIEPRDDQKDIHETFSPKKSNVSHIKSML
jgi:hypothetical protein